MKSGVFGMIAAEEVAIQIGKSDVDNYKKIDKESSKKSKISRIILHMQKREA